MFFTLKNQYKGHWESERNPISIKFNEKMWKVVSVSDAEREYLFGLQHKSDGSVLLVNGEDLEGEEIDMELVEDMIFSRLYNMDNNVKVEGGFEDEINGFSFRFNRYVFKNKKFGLQLANYGYIILEGVLVIIGLAWPAEMEIVEGSYWPTKHSILLSGITLSYENA